MKKFGKLFLALGMIAVFAGCKTSPEELTLTKIEVTNPAAKVEYLVGEDLDTTGLEITATYSDESSKVVTGWTTSGYDKTKAGEQTVTVTYTEEEVTAQTSYTVTVKAIELTKIEITAQPAKKEYFVGAQELDLAGLKVTATYTDGTTADVTDKVTTTGFDSSTAADSQTITVTYGGKTATFTVKINPVLLTGISVTTQPTKKDYHIGDEIDLTGMVVTANYNDGSTKTLGATEYEVTGFDSTAAVESQTITVTYEGKTATFTVKIKPILTGIAVTTQPTKKDYHIGDTLDLTGMVVTASYNDGSTKTLASNEYTVTGFDSTDYVNDKEITVTYNDKTDTFKINVVFSWFEAPKQLPAGTNGTYGTEGTYVLFGVWPQDVVAEADVAGLALNEDAPTTVTLGYLKYVKGSDGNYYVKCAENANGSGYKYKKDDSDVKQGGTTSRWFKVMPIKWRVADIAYAVDGTNGNNTAKLLVAESILTANVPYYEDKDNNRTIDSKIVYPNNYMHSQIRAFLNGISYQGQSAVQSQWNTKGFLQTAFTSDAIDKIITTKVDNAKEQMSYNGTNDMNEDYACGPTDDKIFLLSEKEVVQYSKSGEAYYSFREGNSRIRVTTDFAKANYAYQSTTDGFGGNWWLRSPIYNDSSIARNVGGDGYAGSGKYVNTTYVGVVPALAISF